MAKFRVGDKVRMTVDVYKHAGLVRGVVGLVTSVNGGWIIARFDSIAQSRNNAGDDGWALRADQIELVASAKPMFKVGDRVRVVNSNANAETWNGRAGVIAGYFDEMLPEFAVEITGFAGRIPFGPDELELIAATPPAPSYAVGDKVRIKTQASHFAGRTGAIGAIEISEGQPWLVVKFDRSGDYVFSLDEIEPYVPSPVVWRERAELGKFPVHIERERIDEWVREGREWRKANLGVEGDWLWSSGDAKVFVDDEGTARLYRLEAISDGE